MAERLRFLLAPRHRHGEVVVRVDGTSSPVHVVESLGVPRTEIGELRITEHLIEVFPVRRPQAAPGSGYLLDVHLGTLARRMRLLGLDVAYRNDAADDELVERAGRERRVLLTQDRGLLRRRALAAGAYVRGARPDDQLADVLDRFRPPLAPWTRCLACNGLLDAVAKRDVEHLLEGGTRRTYEEFSRCRECGRVYWRGAHAHRLDAIVATATRCYT